MDAHKIIQNVDVLLNDVAELRGQILLLQQKKTGNTHFISTLSFIVIALSLFFVIAIERHMRNVENYIHAAVINLEIYEDTEDTQ